MAHISRRQRNGRVTYLARYIDPSGRERARSFTRRKDAERFLTGKERQAARHLDRSGARPSSLR